MAQLILTPRQQAAFAVKQKAVPSGCIEWHGSRNADGYGEFMQRPKKWRAHRAAWSLAHGDIPDGQKVLHSCDNPRCVNVAHLRLGDQGDNLRDAYSRDRRVTPPAFLAAAKRDKRGEKNPRARLTAEQAGQIRGSSEPAKAVAALFGVHHNTVRLIRAGKTWGV